MAKNEQYLSHTLVVKHHMHMITLMKTKLWLVNSDAVEDVHSLRVGHAQESQAHFGQPDHVADHRTRARETRVLKQMLSKCSY